MEIVEALSQGLLIWGVLALLLARWKSKAKSAVQGAFALALCGLVQVVALPSASLFSVYNGVDSFAIQRKVQQQAQGYSEVAVSTRWLFPFPLVGGHVFAQASPQTRLVVSLRPGPRIEVFAVGHDGLPRELACADGSSWGVPVVSHAARSCS